MPRHEVSVTTPPDYTGLLTLGRHPDGELDFEDGIAILEDRAIAEHLGRHYPNLEYEGTVSGEDGDDTTADEEAVPETIDEDDTADEGDDATDPPLDPDDHTVDELRGTLDERDFSADELGAIRDAEVAGKNRETALKAIDTALEG